MVENIKARAVSTKKRTGVGGGRKKDSNERKEAPWQKREWNGGAGKTRTGKPRAREKERDEIGATHSQEKETNGRCLGERDELAISVVFSTHNASLLKLGGFGGSSWCSWQ